MDKQNDMAQLRYLEKATIGLCRAGFDTGQIKNYYRPVNWGSSDPYHISVKVSVLYRWQNMDAIGEKAIRRAGLFYSENYLNPQLGCERMVIRKVENLHLFISTPKGP